MEPARRIRALAANPFAWAFLLQAALVLALRGPFEFELDGRRVHAVADDIYITGCFARSLAQGAGLVWFPGADPVEGFTSPVHVLVLSAAHALPFFREEDLGLYTTALGLLALAGAFAMGASIARRLVERAEARTAASTIVPVGKRIAAAAIAAAPVAITWWIAEGFEVSLVLVAALASVRVATGELAPTRRGLALGAIAAAAVWTRMDGVLYVLPGFLVLALDRTTADKRAARRSALVAVGVVAVAIALLFGARLAIFGEWMPNTYYLKLGGSSLVERVLAGVRLGPAVIPAALAAAAGGAWLVARRPIGHSSVPVGALVLLLPMGVAYSIHNGGETWPLHLGADRFAAVGLSTCGIALAAALLVERPRLGARRAAFLAIASTAVLLSPAIPTLLEPRRPYFANLFSGVYQRNEQRWFRLGRALERATLPGSRIAIGGAGAVIYASHRAGIDVHGKCDREIAHMPVLEPGRTPGHQKAYEDHVFATRDPEFSVRQPPDSAILRYVRCTLAGENLWIAKDSRNVVWSAFDGPCPP